MEAHPVIGSHNSYTTFDAIAYANWLAAAQPCWSNMRGTEKTGGGWQIFARIIAIACMLSVRHVRTFSSAGMSSNTFGWQKSTVFFFLKSNKNVKIEWDVSDGCFTCDGRRRRPRRSNNMEDILIAKTDYPTAFARHTHSTWPFARIISSTRLPCLSFVHRNIIRTCVPHINFIGGNFAKQKKALKEILEFFPSIIRKIRSNAVR